MKGGAVLLDSLRLRGFGTASGCENVTAVAVARKRSAGTYRSITSWIFRSRVAKVNGLCRNAIPVSGTRW